MSEVGWYADIYSGDNTQWQLYLRVSGYPDIALDIVFDSLFDAEQWVEKNLIGKKLYKVSD